MVRYKLVMWPEAEKYPNNPDFLTVETEWGFGKFIPDVNGDYTLIDLPEEQKYVLTYGCYRLFDDEDYQGTMVPLSLIKK